MRLRILRECAKRTVMAIIVTDDEMFIGFNDCNHPVEVCPRQDYPTGTGYTKCRFICQQSGHAEETACHLAGDKANGATLYLIGHDYCCEHCEKIMKEYGIKEVIFNKFPVIE